MILVTGAGGLIGRSLCKELRARQIAVREFDLGISPDQDTRNPAVVDAALDGVEGVVHLAAVSRVVWAQRDPELTQAVNVDALHSLLSAFAGRKKSPWLVFASSREVYGEPHSLPVTEDASLAPLNVYARSKVAGEDLINAARNDDIRANIVRFSNVYGCAQDHKDRLVPAFARAAALGGTLRLEGSENMFDLTHVDDVVRGLVTHVEATAAGEILPPIHFVSGIGTTLHNLANIAARTSQQPLSLEIEASRDYDVGRFVGDPGRARALLGWEAKIDIQRGFEMLTEAFRNRVRAAATPAGNMPGAAVYA